MMRHLFSLCGYDHDVIDLVDDGERRFCVASALLTLLASAMSGAGMAYGAVLTVGVVAAPVLGLFATLFVLNLMRLQHAGSGYPLHRPVEALEHWRPSLLGVVVLGSYGVLIGQPLVILFEKPWIDADITRLMADAAVFGEDANGVRMVDGLMRRASVAWDEHLVPSLLLSVAIALLIASPALIRTLLPGMVRAYESERWIKDRIVVDDAWAAAVEVVTETLRQTAPGFGGTVMPPYADPPYNTRPLLYGADPAHFVEGKARYVRVRKKRRPPTPALPAAPRPWWEEARNVRDESLKRAKEDALAAAGGASSPASPSAVDSQSPSTSSPSTSSSPSPVNADAALDATLAAMKVRARQEALAEQQGPAPPPVVSAPSTVPALVVPAPLVAAPLVAALPVAAPPVAASTAAPSSQSLALPPSPPADGPEAGVVVDVYADIHFTVATAARVECGVALQSPRAMAFAARYLDLDVEKVRRVLLGAPPSQPLHQAFEPWNKLPTILLKPVGLALEMELSPLIAIVVGRPVDQVERRLRAAPSTHKVSAVFAAELARVLLRKR